MLFYFSLLQTNTTRRTVDVVVSRRDTSPVEGRRTVLSPPAGDRCRKGSFGRTVGTIGDHESLRIPQHLARKSLRLVFMVRRFYDRTFMTAPWPIAYSALYFRHSYKPFKNMLEYVRRVCRYCNRQMLGYACVQRKALNVWFKPREENKTNCRVAVEFSCFVSPDSFDFYSNSWNLRKSTRNSKWVAHDATETMWCAIQRHRRGNERRSREIVYIRYAVQEAVAVNRQWLRCTKWSQVIGRDR